MVVILVFLTFCGAIVVSGLIKYMASRHEVRAARYGVSGEMPSFWVERPDLVLSPAALPSSRTMPVEFPRDVYYHKGHAWARVEGEKKGSVVRVGLDDLTQQVMGDIEAIEVPSVGAKIRQGEVAWKIRHGGRTLKQLAPISGTVVEVNERVVKDPSIVNRSPYEKGWIMKIEPTSFGEEKGKLMDAIQFQVAFDQVKAALRSSIQPQALGAVYSDGEGMIRGIVDQLDERSWSIFVAEVFHTSAK